jgi:hypothetical protein
MVWLLGMVVAVSGLACASAQKGETSPIRTAANEACFNVRTIDSFSPLNERFVYLRAVGGEQYLLTLDNIYPSLPFATGIAVYGKASRVCSDTGDMLTYANFGNRILCRIVRVEAVASKEAAQRLAKDRMRPRG